MNKKVLNIKIIRYDKIIFLISEKIRWKKQSGLDRAFDILAETFQLIKLSQIALQRVKPNEKIELDCNIILDEAVAVS